MITLTFGEIARIVGGELQHVDALATTSASPIIDSRKAEPETFFVALPGERTDGNDFVGEAIEGGCQWALVTRPTHHPSIIVDDALAALTVLARFCREELVETTFIGITGSQGKTTTKDLVNHILGSYGPTVSPQGSFNNEIGVPVTILTCNEETRFCVVEMGARHKGDISYLCDIAQPDIGVVLVVGSAHLGEFGSEAAIAETKGELISSLSESGIAILGMYDLYTPHMADGMPVKVLRFGENQGADIRATDIDVREGCAHFDLITPTGRTSVGLRLLGMHQVANALAAAAVATAVGIEIDGIAAALSTAESTSRWRMEMQNIGEVLLINDSYNANPESMAAALRTLALIAQERGGVSWAFVGKMHELGESEASDHREIGRLASELGIDNLVSVGTRLYLDGLDLDMRAGDEITTHYVLTQEEALKFVQFFSKGDAILVKASRAEHLDELAEKLAVQISNKFAFDDQLGGGVEQ